MPRQEVNRPSHRMGLVLDDFDELSTVYDESMALVAELSPTLFAKLPPKPAGVHVVAEKTRRQLTLGKLETARERMAHYRARARLVINGPELAPEIKASILAEIDKGMK